MVDQIKSEREQLEQQAVDAMREFDIALQRKDQAIECLVEFNSHHGSVDD